jgi:multimeric flavodoxin WrbA
MKVLALNSSPRGGGQSKTEIMLKSLVEGMVEAGAEVENVDQWPNVSSAQGEIPENSDALSCRLSG